MYEDEKRKRRKKKIIKKEKKTIKIKNNKENEIHVILLEKIIRASINYF